MIATVPRFFHDRDRSPALCAEERSRLRFGPAPGREGGRPTRVMLRWRVSLMQIDIDEEALAEAMSLSGVKTKKDTVNLALREFAARHRRIAPLEHYATLAAGWDFEGWERGRKSLAPSDMHRLRCSHG
jgi:Arc/MetJ family transcription regulator